MQQTHDSLPTSLYTAEQVRAIDRSLIGAGTSGYELMRRAARATWQAIGERWPDVRTLTVLAGSGNNAGDGYLVAALARRAGWTVRVLVLGEPARLSRDAAQAYGEAFAVGVAIEDWSAMAELQGVVVDALLGTGARGDIRAPYRQAIEQINASGRPVVAVDIPSGLCADTGRVLGAAVRADLTVTFIALKRGLFTAEGPAKTGQLRLEPLVEGPFQAPGEAVVRLAATTVAALPARSPTAHKGHFGHLLLVGGDRGTAGAALLMAQAALRSGGGMISVATRPENLSAFQMRQPELMAHGVDSGNQLLALAEKAGGLVVGPGLGQGAWSRSLLSAAVASGKSQVWDADALNLLASGVFSLPEDCVLTPHPGEAARLLECAIGDVQANRFEAASSLAKRYRATVVLKGAGSLVASPDGRLALCDHGHPAMATAGLGDVLAGVIGALRGQGLDAWAAACLGVWLHARAGEQEGRDNGRGLAAGDLASTIRRLIEEHSPCLPLPR